jgi:tetratricopeptide (TPR) repeat protein
VPAVSAEHNLLVGALALQLDFVARDELLGAARDASSVGEPEPLLESLRRLGLLGDEECVLLAALVDRQLSRFAGDAEACLARCDSAGQFRRLVAAALSGTPLPGAAETIGHDPAGFDPHATRHDDPYVTTPLGAQPPSDVTIVSAGDAPTEPHVPSGESNGSGGRGGSGYGPRARGAAERYRVVKAFSRGGLGQVSLARDEEVGREVALKEILPAHADSPEARQRFLMEAEITGSLEHPGVVPVYGLGQYADGRPFYAMRLIRGDNLQLAIEEFHKQQLAPDRELRFRQLLGRFVDVCNAIDYAHNRCILHRDLKPGNIMLGKYGETLVVDWGLAKTLGTEAAPPDSGERPVRPSAGSNSTQTRLGRVVGTPAYMSPEQAAGRVDMLGPASDIYSLGATLYHLLTGQPPFANDDADVLLSKVQKGQFTPPRTVRSDVPKPLEAICLMAMAVRPHERYRSARDLADDVERFLADEPIVARPDSLAGRVGRWARRHRGAVVTSGIALAAIAGALALGVVLLNAANQRAERNFTMARSAIRDYYVTISEDTLLEQPGMQPLREQLLRQALEYYKDFLASEQNDVALLDEVAQANYIAGQITAEIESPAKAVRYYQESLEIAKKLVDETPHDESRLASYGRTLNALGGTLNALQQYEESEAAFGQAEEVRRELVEMHPENEEYVRTLANTIMNRGTVAEAAGDVKRGLDQWQEAQSLRAEQLKSGVADAATATQLRGDAAESDFNRGLFYLREGERAAAQQHLASAAAGFEQVRQTRPEDLETQYNLALSRRTLGDLRVAEDNFEAALGEYRQAADLLELLRVRNPQVTKFKHAYGTLQVAIAELSLGDGAADEALAAINDAVTPLAELVEFDGADRRYQRDLAVAHLVRAKVQIERDDADAAKVDADHAVALLEVLATADAENADYREQLELARAVRDSLQEPL